MQLLGTLIAAFLGSLISIKWVQTTPNRSNFQHSDIWQKKLMGIASKPVIKKKDIYTLRAAVSLRTEETENFSQLVYDYFSDINQRYFEQDKEDLHKKDQERARILAESLLQLDMLEQTYRPPVRIKTSHIQMSLFGTKFLDKKQALYQQTQQKLAAHQLTPANLETA